MKRAAVSLFALLVIATCVGSAPALARGHHRGTPTTYLGPGAAGVHDMGKKAIIRMSKHGYVYIAGKQSSHLRVTFNNVHRTLRYRDTHTQRFKSLANGCRREHVKTGVSAVCKVPHRFDGHRMFVQVWPRLGNDYVDGHTLPARFRLWVLADAGNDVVKCGPGADFVNGAKGNDRITGGAGRDWLRAGPGHDRVQGGAGHDRVTDDNTPHP